ncbi:MAG: GGDEF domain-containing protein [Blastocatellia bacterium]|nr:GGDEF domain-containing protein [Blastocatellia bacterium]
MDDNQTVKLDKVGSGSNTAKRPTLIVLQGESLGSAVPLGGQMFTIGRGSDCELRVDDNLASRAHARLESAAGGLVYCIVDLGSTNGTFVNSQVVEDPYVLRDGDKIRVGRHVFKFALLDDDETEFQERIQQMIIRDDLTNLLTQRSFVVELERQLLRRSEQADRGQVSILMMDLDHFKTVNDTYGHVVGSQTIKQVGEIIEASLRKSDVAARYGGEEYVAYLTDIPSSSAPLIAERIRETIGRHEISVSRKGANVRLSVTISIGISTYPVHGEDPIELIEKADLALYRAKVAGRNRVVEFDPLRDRFDEAGYQRLELRSLIQDADSKA